MDPQKGTSWRFPTDVLVEILRRLPPNTRRRFRLVCRNWRKLVDKRSFRHRSKTLVAPDRSSASAFLMDDQTGRRKNLWTSITPPRCRAMRIVGTCNGLVCLCDDGLPGGAITVANPVTGETLDVPPLPLPPPCGGDAGQDQCFRGRWHQAYSFGYHPTTRRYKVMHVPCRFGRDWEFNTVQVLTLGEETWRDVVTDPGSRCDLDAGIVDINGTTYWTTVAGSVMAFDLDDETITPIDTIPSRPGRKFLTVVHGMLGVAYRDTWVMTMDTTMVRVMATTTAMGKPQRLNRRYNLHVRPPRSHHGLTRPHFLQDSGHMLTWGYGGLYKHRPTTGIDNVLLGSVLIDENNQGTMVADIKSCLDTWAFTYVETKESLSPYRLGDS